MTEPYSAADGLVRVYPPRRGTTRTARGWSGRTAAASPAATSTCPRPTGSRAPSPPAGSPWSRSTTGSRRCRTALADDVSALRRERRALPARPPTTSSPRGRWARRVAELRSPRRLGARRRERRRQPRDRRDPAPARATAACAPGRSSCSPIRRCSPCSPSRMPRCAPRSTPTPRPTASAPTPCAGCTRTTSAARVRRRAAARRSRAWRRPRSRRLPADAHDQRRRRRAARLGRGTSPRRSPPPGVDVEVAHRARHPARPPQPPDEPGFAASIDRIAARLAALPRIHPRARAPPSPTRRRSPHSHDSPKDRSHDEPGRRRPDRAVEPPRRRPEEHELRRRQHVRQGHRDRPRHRRAGRAAVGQGLRRRPRHPHRVGPRGAAPRPHARARRRLPRRRPRGRDGRRVRLLPARQGRRGAVDRHRDARPRRCRARRPPASRLGHRDRDRRRTARSSRRRSSAARSCGCRGVAPASSSASTSPRSRRRTRRRSAASSAGTASPRGATRRDEAEANSLWIIETAQAYIDANGKKEPVRQGAQEVRARCRRPSAARRPPRSRPTIRGIASHDKPMVGHFTDDPRVLEFLASAKAPEARRARHQLPRPLPAHQGQADAARPARRTPRSRRRSRG